MTQAFNVDVLVVGLGPAGGAAALAAARAGLSVAAVEKKQTVGVPVQCAEFIPLPLSPYAQSAGVCLQRIAGMNSYLPSGACAHSDFPGLMVDRSAFDQALAAQAQAAGAALHLNGRLSEFDGSAAIIATPQGELRMRYRLLIAADGPHSAVARALGLPPLATVDTRQYTVPLTRPHADTDIWLSDAYPGGYAWLFPKGEYANLGLGMDKRADLKTPLDALHQELVEEGRVGAAIIHRTGGAIPVGGMRERLVVANALLVGDAAGLTHPITGAGIAAAVISGECAGQAAAAWLAGASRALEDFEQDIRDRFETTLQRAVARRKWLAARQRSAEAKQDATHRRGWIAFPEYFHE